MGDKAKKLMFKVLFSKNTVFLYSKEKLKRIIPNIIEICNNYNSKLDKMIPRLCQLLESRIIIQNICKQFTEVALFPFYTVHDSIHYHPKDEQSLIDIYNDVFIRLELPVLKYK